MRVAAPKEIEYEDGLRLVQRLLANGRPDAAADLAARLCRHHPDDPRAHNQAGIALQRQKRFAEAIRHFRRALVLYAHAGEIWANVGMASYRSGNPREGLRNSRRAGCCRPDLPEIRLAMGLSLLALGDYLRGFAEYEHRPERTTVLEKYAAFGIPAWTRSLVPGQRVLLVSEQGAGDTVQFLRFVRPLAERGIEVAVACPEPLRRLVATVDGVSATCPRQPSDAARGCDGVELLMSLPACLTIREDAVPAPRRYLDPPPPRLALPAGGRLRVGLCWTGSPAHPRDEPRRIPFAEISRLLDIDGAEFYSLQVGPGREDLAGEPRVVNLARHIDDFADTASMVDQMDLVISIDTSVAHIAGALGRPVWTLLAHVADWRWGLRGETTPWYPTMRLVRQKRPGDWGGVVDEVRVALRQAVTDFAERRRAPLPAHRMRRGAGNS